MVFSSLKLSALALTSALMISCGGSGSSDSEETVRPKTLEDLVIVLDGQTISMEFLRDASSPSEATSSNPETGSIIYSLVDGNTQYHEAISGASFDYHWPQSVTSMTYTYTPINAAAGQLLVKVTGADFLYSAGNDFTEGSNRVGQNINAFSLAQLMNAASDPAGGGSEITVRFTITFNSGGGGTLTGVTLQVQPDAINHDVYFLSDTDMDGDDDDKTSSTLTSTTLAFLTEGTILTDQGLTVPVNYSQDNDNYISEISNNSLDEQTVLFTPDTISDSFSCQCTLTDTTTSGTITIEEGTCVYLDTDDNPVFGSADYTYQKVDGTDDATFVLVGGFANGTTPGTYTLSFTSVASDIQRAAGTYTVSAPGRTYDGETGEFEITNAIIE